jgi:MFS family permease
MPLPQMMFPILTPLLPGRRPAANRTFQVRAEIYGINSGCGSNDGEAARSHASQPAWRRTSAPSIAPSECGNADRVDAEQPGTARLIMRVFLPFVAAYYLSFLFRTINATISAPLTSEFGLGAGDLGLLTSVYFLLFAAAQIPVGIILDRYGPRRIQSALLVAVAAGAAIFSAADSFWLLLAGRALIGLGVAAALTAGLKALVIWFPKERVPFLNGLMVMLGALGAVTATLPVEALLADMGWRKIFEISAAISACCALLIFFVVPEAPSSSPATSVPVAQGLRTVYADRRFWRLAPLSASCIGTAWALQGLWAAPWLVDVGAFDRTSVMRHLFIMAVALSVGALLLGVMADRLRRRGVEVQTLLAVVGAVFIMAQLGLVARFPLPPYLLWAVVAAVGAATVLSYSILAEYFPKELVGRANAALNVFHITSAFVVQYGIGLVLQFWTPQDGHYPETAFQCAFGINIGVQLLTWAWFALPTIWPSIDTPRKA